jgi:hypothetical protein
MRDHPAGVPHAPRPLARRMVARGLDLAAVARSEPGAFRDLRDRCAKCRSLERCVRDLQSDPTGPLPYCPNGGLIDFLTELWWLRILL